MEKHMPYTRESKLAASAMQKTEWAMLSVCWFKTDVRQKILKIMLDTFGKCATPGSPLYLVDGSPSTIAANNQHLSLSYPDVHYVRIPTEDGIPRMRQALERIECEYVVTICDDFVLIGNTALFLKDVAVMTSMMKQHPQIDAFYFYCAQLLDAADGKLRFAQPHLKTQMLIGEQAIKVSACPRFFYNLGVHRKDRLIAALQYLESNRIKTFRAGELSTEPRRLTCRVMSMPFVANLLWRSTYLRRRWGNKLYKTILLKPQESAYYHLGELESSVLNGEVRSARSRELLLTDLMTKDSLSRQLSDAVIMEGEELAHC